MPPQPSLPESRSRGFRHSSSYGHTVLCPNRKTYSSLRLLSLEIAGFSLFINALRRFWKAFRREKRRGFTTVFRIMQAHFANKMLTACGDQGPNPAGVLFIGRDFLRRLAHGVDNGLAVPSSKESK